MLPKIYCFALLLLSCSTVWAQDLIVTTENDTINARITKENKKAIYFYFMKNEETRSIMLNRSQIATYKKDFFEHNEVPKRIKTGSGYEGRRIRLNMEGGFGYRIGKLPSGIDPGFREYLRRLKSGGHIGLDIHYFIDETFALGVTYNTFRTSAGERNISVTFPDRGTAQGIVNTMAISFVGPSVMTKLPSRSNKDAFFSALSIGYLDYRDELRAGSRFVLNTAGTFGLGLHLGYDLGIGKYWSIGASTSLTTGLVNKITSEEDGVSQTINLKDTQGVAESLSRISISLGLKFYL